MIPKLFLCFYVSWFLCPHFYCYVFIFCSSHPLCWAETFFKNRNLLWPIYPRQAVGETLFISSQISIIFHALLFFTLFLFFYNTHLPTLYTTSFKITGIYYCLIIICFLLMWFTSTLDSCLKIIEYYFTLYRTREINALRLMWQIFETEKERNRYNHSWFNKERIENLKCRIERILAILVQMKTYL